MVGENMIKPKEETQSIKRVKTIDINEIREINTCGQLVEECLFIINNINIDVGYFLMKNKLFGYSGKVDINKGMEEIIELKNKLKDREANEELGYLDSSILDFGEEDSAPEIIELTAVYYMYLGNFTKGIALIDFYKTLRPSKESTIITNIEILNGFIFKYNLSIDFMKMENYTEACDILESHYKNNLRLEMGDQFLIILYECLGQYKKSKKVKEYISEVCDNPVYNCEIEGNGKIGSFKTQIAIGILFVFIVGGSALINKRLFNDSNNDISVNAPNIEVTKDTSNNKPSNNANNTVEEKQEKAPQNKETIKNENKRLMSIDELEESISNLDNKEDIDKIEIELEELKERVSNNRYERMKKQFITKKQAIFYNSGMNNLKANKADEAINDLKLAYNQRIGEYLDSHITYYLAYAVKQKNENEAIKYYIEYVDKYGKSKDSSYTEEALYNLAILNSENGSVEEAQKYANVLQNDYPKSIYNNEKIRKIIK